MPLAAYARVSDLMDSDAGRPSAVTIILMTLLALALQVLLPVYVDVFGYFDLPLLVLVYSVLLGRNVIGGLLIGAAIGLAQDGLTHGPVGLFGVVKTIVGYLAATTSLLVEVNYPGVRSVLVAGFFLLHQGLFWTISEFLLARPTQIEMTRSVILAAAHAGLALAAYPLLDRIRRPR
jgi:rod shape-determining protein MreD